MADDYSIDGEAPTGAMVALVPSEADAARLALVGGDPASALHLTLVFLGEGVDWEVADQETFSATVGNWAASAPPIEANAFAAALFNPGPDQAFVLMVGKGKGQESGHSPITQSHDEVLAVFDDAQIPEQHSPWVAHVTLGYGDSVDFAQVVDRTGPIVFDRIRVAFGESITDIPLSGGEEQVMDMPMEAAMASEGRPWSGPIAFENEMTGDGRIFAGGSIGWLADSFPWPFRWTPEDHGGHDGAVVIGRVDGLYRDPSSPGTIFASGIAFTGESAPPEAARWIYLMENGAAGGVSVDGDSAEFNIVEKTNANGEVIGLEQHFTQMRLRTITAVDIPAFITGRIALADSLAAGVVPVVVGTADELEAAMIASAIPTVPPLDWFTEPALGGPTPITVTADGRVFGHLALFGTCHIAMPQGCVTPPRGATYSYFHTGEVLTASGDPVAVGHLTFGTGHADMAASGASAAAHYDNTATVAADVRAGDDTHGIWVAGALRPHLTDEQIREFRAAPLSGDWRRIGGRLELVAALAVNTPGFPVPRTRARVLVASGSPQTVVAVTPSSEFDDAGDDERAVAKQRLANTVRLGDLLQRVGGR
jgi:2'-5' RNA ligase